MNILLDTCALLALARADLSPRARAALRAAPEAVTSVVSPWEVAIKVARGRLRLQESPARWFEILKDRYDVHEIPLDVGTATAAAALPPLHGDPFDRVIVALALATDRTILTADRNIARYPGVKTIW